MAGLAPLAASPTTTTAPTNGAGAVPGTIAPDTTPPKQNPVAPDAAGFTAFPSSYAGFGQGGTAFGTVGVVDGKLSVVTAPGPPPVKTDRAPSSVPPPPPQANPVASATADLQTVGGPTLGQIANSVYTAIPPRGEHSLQTSNATDEKVTTEASTVSNATQTDDTHQTPGSSTLDKTQPQGTTLETPAAPQPNPSAGLIGGGGPPPIPGGTAVENNPALGLLGAPATNPIYIQAQTQAQNAAEEAAAAAAAAAAKEAAARQQLQQVDFRIAAARADDNDAAVAQLQPTVVKLTGEIQGQTFAGVGTTPPQPFARPEIPTVFLNIAS